MHRRHVDDIVLFGKWSLTRLTLFRFVLCADTASLFTALWEYITANLTQFNFNFMMISVKENANEKSKALVRVMLRSYVELNGTAKLSKDP